MRVVVVPLGIEDAVVEPLDQRARSLPPPGSAVARGSPLSAILPATASVLPQKKPAGRAILGKVHVGGSLGRGEEHPGGAGSWHPRPEERGRTGARRRALRRRCFFHAHLLVP